MGWWRRIVGSRISQPVRIGPRMGSRSDFRERMSMSLEQWILVITGVSTLALAIFTGIYVWLTRQLVTSSNEANRESQRAIRQQIRAMRAAYLSWVIYGKEDELRFRLSNIGSGPAYDVDVLAVAHYNYVDHADVLNDVREESTGSVPSPEVDHEGFAHVRDRVVYGHAFPMSEVDGLFGFPGRPGSMSVLLQYRDVSGENLAQIYWFFRSLDPHDKGWKLGSCVPKVIERSPRVELDLHGGLTVGEPQELPDETKEEYDKFKDSFEMAVYSGRYRSYVPVEDRGQWKRI